MEFVDGWFVEMPVPRWDEVVGDAPMMPTTGGLLDGLPDYGAGDGLSVLMEPKDIATISDAASATGDAVPGGQGATQIADARVSPDYDGVCRLPDGTLHPYIDAGGGYGNVIGGRTLNTSGQAGIGAAANGTAMPTLPKRGGVGGGGASGPVTSPASSAARGLTGSARFNGLEPLTGTASVGGSIGRAIPVLGVPLMLMDFLDHTNAPVCTPVPDPTRIY